MANAMGRLIRNVIVRLVLFRSLVNQLFMGVLLLFFTARQLNFTLVAKDTSPVMALK